MICPRRNEGGYQPKDEDIWEERNGIRCCSYCGSVHPDDFIINVKNGVPIGATDKNYKAYIHGIGSSKFYFKHLSTDQMKEFINLYNDRICKFAGDYDFYVLPFFMTRD